MNLFKNTCLFLIAGTFLASCGSTEEKTSKNTLIVDKDVFDSIDVATPSIDIISLKVVDDCLEANLGFSGCDEDHDMSLVTSGEVAESNPVQVYFKFRDNKPQSCLAYFTKTYTFDLSPMASVVQGESKARMIFVQKDKEVMWED